MNYGDGLYGGMFVCGMYAAAFFENDPRKVVEAGLACIPAKSEYALLIRDLLDWSAQYPNDWRKVWQLVEDKWDKNDPCPDGALQRLQHRRQAQRRLHRLRPALRRKATFSKTMEISTRCGQDSDCNPSSAAGVLGVMLGYDRIPEQLQDRHCTRWRTRSSISPITPSTTSSNPPRRGRSRSSKPPAAKSRTPRSSCARAETQSAEAGAVEPRHPGSQTRAGANAWTFRGKWEGQREPRQPRGQRSGARASTGWPSRSSGGSRRTAERPMSYLDGKKVGMADAYIVENTHDNVLWNVYGLKPGNHTVRLVTTGAADPRSKGKRVRIRAR